MLLMLKSVVKQRVTIQFCILNKSAATRKSREPTITRFAEAFVDLRSLSVIARQIRSPGIDFAGRTLTRGPTYFHDSKTRWLDDALAGYDFYYVSSIFMRSEAGAARDYRQSS